MTSTPVPELASAAAAFDPTVLALLSIFGGAALTALAGLVGWLLQGRREHKRWLRDQRRELFIEVLAVIDHMIQVSSRVIALEAKIPALTSKFPPLQPNSTHDAAREIETARTELEELRAQTHNLAERLNGLRAPMSILGSKKVTAALESNAPDLISDDLEKAEKSKAAIVAAMRTGLRVRD